jgi:hypothetical protein
MVTEALKEYWLANCATLHCTICGNVGIIDSRGVATPAGEPCGRLNWCICPNGQVMRKASKQALPTAEQFARYRR